MAVTILDVAKLCGYSKATVSRAFASPEQVSDKTREKVYAAARALNYTPDAIARAMVRGRTDNIGFVIYEKQYPVVLDVYKRQAMQRDCKMTFTGHDRSFHYRNGARWQFRAIVQAK